MLYAFGSNGSGQLGVGHYNDLSKPESISNHYYPLSLEIKQVAAGGNHTAILLNGGKVRSTGNNEDGRGGITSMKQIEHPVPTTMPLVGSKGTPLQVKQIAATWSSSTFLCEDGALYVCGTGDSGELGLGPEVRSSHTLQRIGAFPPPGSDIVFLASGMAHTVAILSNGEVYGWGKGRKGQLGEPTHDVWWPRRISGINFGAAKAVCGKDFTLVVGEQLTGEMVVLGPNSNDRFGIKSNAPASLPGWKSISASWGSIFVLMPSGDIVAWGRDDHGQLPPQGLPEIEAISAGSEHCLALTRTGKVLAWGWGEHGNCGMPTDDKGDVRGSWNEIEMPGRARRIFAGCATSFIETEDG